MNKAYKYRIYPEEEQIELMQKTFGCCRFAYNYYLARQKKNREDGGRYISKYDCNTDCNNVLKNENPWLKEVDKFAITNAIFFLDQGFQRFFQKLGGYPKFKNKHRSRRSYTTNYTNGNIKVLENQIQIPKIGKVRAVVHRVADETWQIKQATVSQERDGSFYVSILYQYEKEIIPVEVVRGIGLDYKSDGLYMDSDGKCAKMPHFYRENQKKLAKAQRKLRHKQIGSHNYYKQQRKAAKIQRKSVNQRKDYLHKKSTEIANQYDVVCVEDLDMRAMANRGFGNGKATNDNGYGRFLSMLEYKLFDRGKKLVKIDRWYPSSQICSHCGIQKKMPLQIRTFECSCGLHMDRDWNAAVNILHQGCEQSGIELPI